MAVGDSVQVGDELATMQVHTRSRNTSIVQAKAALDGLDIVGVEYNRFELQKRCWLMPGSGRVASIVMT